MPPLAREADCGTIDPVKEPFSAFVFKIQANMNKMHRDRIAFMRICSGKFEADKEVYHVQGKRTLRLSQPQHHRGLRSGHFLDWRYSLHAGTQVCL